MQLYSPQAEAMDNLDFDIMYFWQQASVQDINSFTINFVKSRQLSIVPTGGYKLRGFFLSKL